ncbi:sugar transferase [Sphingomonas sp. C3-2]|uniref:sugar transferase n=1 Tax=Sphingomonas sp. C3-2 TaxID=3062169 RepID=UPI00294B706A|nr:sugar transferase [Sphingomonas sp. C3-2]WOK35096.1 sugar transferase [Sphingomonas sp. C3-2]
MSAKRAFDLILASVALAMLSVPMLVVMLAIYLSDRGPVFYRQIRVGRNCQPFGMLKFRSMVINADKVGGYATASGDPRITSIGRFIRRTSLDELPQLLNVLQGNMSIVGPRPDVPAQETLYTPDQWRARHRVRPGITGLAQAVARSTASAEERTALDLAYVQTASVFFDLKIILMTVRQLIARTGN